MRLISSLLLGLIMGLIIGKCFILPIKHHGPNSNEIIKYIYQKDNKFYTFTPEICPCPI